MQASTYPRERLQDWDNVAAWTSTFLIVAGSVHIADYYTTPGYEDPNLVNYISVSRHAQLLLEAEAAVPRLAGGSSFVELQEQATQRKLAVYSHYSNAIDKERAVMQASWARNAAAFLRSALHPQLHADVLHIHEAYGMWQHIQAKAKQPTEPRDPSRFYGSYRKVARLPMESLVAFTTRTEASIDAFLAQLAPILRDTTDWDEAAYHGAIAATTSIFDQLRTVLLGHALSGQGDFKTWFDKTPDCSLADIKAWMQCSTNLEVQTNKPPPMAAPQAPRHTETVSPEPQSFLCTYCRKVKKSGQGEHTDATCVRRAVDEANDQVRGDYSPPSVPHMTCSYCQLGGHRRDDGCPLATKDMETLGVTEAALPLTRQCSYCNAVGHLDGACPVLSVHARFQKISSTYRMPSGQRLPRSPASVSKSARACGYCLSTKHDEQHCRWLAISVQRGTLRPDYAFMNPPRFLTDGIKSEEPPAPPSTSKPPKTKKSKRKKMTKQEGHSSTSKNCQANDANEKKRRKVS